MSKSAFFTSSEHLWIGNQIQLQLFANGKKISSTKAFLQYNPKTNNTLTYGEILALSGDYFGLPGAPISNSYPSSPLSYVKVMKKILKELEKLMEVGSIAIIPLEKKLGKQLRKDLSAIFKASRPLMKIEPQTLEHGQYKSDLFTPNYETLQHADYTKEIAPLLAAIRTESNDSDLDFAGLIKETRPLNDLTNGRYVALLLTNWDHFGADAYHAYISGHRVAMETAKLAGSKGDLSGLHLAYAMNAYADHFLSDLFSSGHIRTPRRKLAEARSAGAILSNWMHDEDGQNGLIVNNSLRDSWLSYGDGKLSESPENKAMVVKAVQASADEIAEAYFEGTGVGKAGGLIYAPLPLRNYYGTLYRFGHKDVKEIFRTKHNDINGSSLFLYNYNTNKIKRRASPIGTIGIKWNPASTRIWKWESLSKAGIQEAYAFYKRKKLASYQSRKLNNGLATIFQHQNIIDTDDYTFAYKVDSFKAHGSEIVKPVFQAYPLQAKGTIEVGLFVRKIAFVPIFRYRLLLDGIANTADGYQYIGPAFYAYKEAVNGRVPIYFFTKKIHLSVPNKNLVYTYYSTKKDDPLAKKYGYKLSKDLGTEIPFYTFPLESSSKSKET